MRVFSVGVLVSMTTPPELVLPSPWKRLMRPLPLGLVNSLWAMPILSRTHSTWSTEPVAMAILGMSPCVWLFGMFMENVVSVQAVVMGTWAWTRHLPVTATMGMAAPTGTLVRMNLPSTPVVVPTSGSPDGGAPGAGQLTPGVNAATGALGMYTVTLGNGSVPLGALTYPVIVVVWVPGHLTCCRQRPVVQLGVWAKAWAVSPNDSSSTAKKDRILGPRR